VLFTATTVNELIYFLKIQAQVDTIGYGTSEVKQ
jgi:hypothetical protein